MKNFLLKKIIIRILPVTALNLRGELNNKKTIAGDHEDKNYGLDKIVELEERCKGHHTQDPGVDNILWIEEALW